MNVVDGVDPRSHLKLPVPQPSTETKGWRSIARVFDITLRTSIRRTFAERGGLLVAVVFYLLVTAVLAGIWRIAAHGHHDNIVGYSAVALTWYIAMSEAVTIPLNMRMIADIGDDVASGGIAIELLRPVSVLGVRLATELGRALPKLLLCLGCGAALASLTGGAVKHPAALLLAAPSAILAITCNIIAQHAFAATSFWLRDAGSAWFLYQKLVFILGGMLFPLQVMPSWLHNIARWLPFEAMAYAPARLAAGFFDPGVLLIQLAWIVVIGALATLVFRAGEQRLQVVGG